MMMCAVLLYARRVDISVGGSMYCVEDDSNAYYMGEENSEQTTVTVLEDVAYNGNYYTVVGFRDPYVWYSKPSIENIVELHLPCTIKNDDFNIKFLREKGKKLAAVYVDEYKSELVSLGGAMYSADMKTLLFIPPMHTGTLTVPETVTKLDAECGVGAHITDISLPDGLLSIGDNALYGSLIRHLFIPDKTSIGSLGSLPELELLSFGNSVKSIPYTTLGKCDKLREVRIPSSVTSIATSVFDMSPSLVAVTVDDSNPNYKSVDGVLYDKDVSDIQYVPKGIVEYTAPPSLNSIKSLAFKNRTKLRAVDFSESAIYAIGDEAFYDCKNLAYINTGNKLTELGVRAFGIKAYDKSNASREVILSENLTVLPAYAFSNNIIRSLSMGNKIVSINEGAFYGCNMSDLQDIYIPYSVETIRDYAFCYLKANNNQFSRIYLGDKVKKIGDHAFDIKCDVKEFYCAAAVPPECNEAAFSSEMYAYPTLYVPEVNVYKSASPWGYFIKTKYYDFSGVEEVADGGEEFSVSCVGGELRVECADGTAVTVWSADGREAYSGTGSCAVALPRGIYIVRAGSSTRKVMM